MYFNGYEWVSFCSPLSWAGGIGYFQLKNGIPFLPSKSSFTGTPPPGSIFYSTTESSVMVADGRNVFQRLAAMSANSAAFSGSSEFHSLGTGVELLCLPVLMTAPVTGVEIGAMWINGTNKELTFTTDLLGFH